MEKENNKNKKIYILIALSLCTFVIMTIGTTFSFFTSTIRGGHSKRRCITRLGRRNDI